MRTSEDSQILRQDLRLYSHHTSISKLSTGVRDQNLEYCLSLLSGEDPSRDS